MSTTKKDLLTTLVSGIFRIKNPPDILHTGGLWDDYGISLEKEADKIGIINSRMLLIRGHPRKLRGNNPFPYNSHPKTLSKILINDSFICILNYEEDLVNLHY